MSFRARLSADETRCRIIEAAEEHFRRIGYAKTAVSDIAHALGMSAANIYRFFASKSAINDAICRKLLDTALGMARDIASRPEPPSERLGLLIVEMQRFCTARLTDEQRIHDMVTVAMQESWPAIEDFKMQLWEVHRAIIAEGVALGEFAPTDPALAARTICAMTAVVHHPSLIAERPPAEVEETARNIAAFVLRGLRNNPSPTAGQPQ